MCGLPLAELHGLVAGDPVDVCLGVVEDGPCVHVEVDPGVLVEVLEAVHDVLHGTSYLVDGELPAGLLDEVCEGDGRATCACLLPAHTAVRDHPELLALEREAANCASEVLMPWHSNKTLKLVHDARSALLVKPAQLNDLHPNTGPLTLNPLPRARSDDLAHGRVVLDCRRVDGPKGAVSKLLRQK